MTKKVLIASFLIIGVVAAFWLPFGSDAPEQVACTTEAKICADGSSVGRSGPQCQFAACPEEFVTIYYYNPAIDMDASGKIQLCSEKGLVGVKRQIPDSAVRLNAAIRALISGELTDAERAQGVTTEFPLPGFGFVGSSMHAGRLELTFSDPQKKTSGGSCRVGILRAQVEKTASQFPGVEAVFIAPEELFQP